MGLAADDLSSAVGLGHEVRPKLPSAYCHLTAAPPPTSLQPLTTGGMHHPPAPALAKVSTFSGDLEAARRLPCACTTLEEQLTTLESTLDTMARAPERFGLSTAVIRSTRADVDDMRSEAAEALRLYDQAAGLACGLGLEDVEGGRKGLAGGSWVRCCWDGWGMHHRHRHRHRRHRYSMP